MDALKLFSPRPAARPATLLFVARGWGKPCIVGAGDIAIKLWQERILG